VLDFLTWLVENIDVLSGRQKNLKRVREFRRKTLLAHPASKVSTAHSSKLVCVVRQGEFVIAQPAGRYDSPRAGYWSADDLAGLDHVLHAGALIVLILRAGYSCPLDRLAASRLLPPRSRLERSDLVL